MSKHEDHINLIDFIFTLLKHKVLIASIIGASVICMIFYNIVATPKYKVETSFFVASQNQSSGSSILGYAKMLGINTPTNLTKYIFAISQSGNLKTRIIEDVTPLYPELSTQEIKREINFRKNFSLQKDKNETLILKVENKSPEIALAIASSFLKHIQLLNQELEITAQKEIITILDPPSKPSLPYKPRKLLNIIFAIIGSSAFAVVIVFLKEYIQTELENRKEHD